MGVLEGKIDSFCGNLGHLVRLTASNGVTVCLSFGRYCLLVRPKAKLFGIEVVYFALVLSRDMRYGQLGNSQVEFCLFQGKMCLIVLV